MTRWSKVIAKIAIFLIFLLSMTIIVLDRFDIDLERFYNIKSVNECIIDENTGWNYLLSGQSPSMGNVWTLKDYNVEGWARGTQKQISDYVEGNSTEFGTLFMRTEFEFNSRVTDAQMITGSITYKDAVIVYLNGEIIFAGNVPDGGYESNLNDGAANPVDEYERRLLKITDLSSLKRGRNVLAVEVHREDENSEVFFECEDLKFQSQYIEDEKPVTDGIMIRSGQSEDEVVVSWRTAEDTYYELLYCTGLERVTTKKFIANANSVLVERRKLADGRYVNKVTLRNLGEKTKYYYAIAGIGSDKLTAIEEFTTGGQGNLDFELVGHCREAVSGYEYPDSKTKVIIPAFDSNMFSWKNNIVYAAPNVTEGLDNCEEFSYRLTGRAASDDIGDTYYVCKDTLIISINALETDITKHCEYILDMMSEKNRKWTVVIMSPSVLSGGTFWDESEKKEWLEALRECNIDVLITSEGIEECSSTDDMIIFNIGEIDSTNIGRAEMSVKKQTVTITGSEGTQYVLSK